MNPYIIQQECSKRIKNKNIKIFWQAIIYYSIKAAIKSNIFEKLL